ncbi:uncharacterized protein LOC113147456 [Cyclospora cayetanensis]|uniref:Uncharacterized protein LOC113147456 n=1 Tax=Cyclospora cayetanensis TaxID=88456 RepID=A0A6P6S1A9_9EIME|nr:uncharacterized protein LOC113147456 [Cyclospora cayetanensis]
MAASRAPVTDIDPDSDLYQDALAQGAIASARTCTGVPVPLLQRGTVEQLEIQARNQICMGGTASLLMKKKDRRNLVVLECTEARAEGKPPSRYTTTKNRKNTPEPLQLRKYNKFLRRHTLHKELK